MEKIKSNAKVAILLATYNGEKYILELLESLKKQTFTDFECYIHDDGSTDRTVEILKKFEKEHTNFILLEYPRLGNAQKNFVSLMEKVEAEYIMFCDQDDIWKNNKIEQCIAKYTNKDAKLVCSDLEVVDKDKNLISKSYFSLENRDYKDLRLQKILKKNIAPGCTMMLNRKLVEECIKNKELLEYLMHDWGIFVIASSKYNIEIIKDSLILYRQHENNQVGAKRKTGILYVLTQLRDLITGKKIEFVKENIRHEKKNAKLLLKSLEKKDENYELIYGLANIDKKNKLERIKFYVNNDLVSMKGKSLIRLFFV